MKVSPDMTLREARDLFYKAHGFPEDGGVSEDKWSPIEKILKDIYGHPISVNQV